MEQTPEHGTDSRSDQAIEWLARLRADDLTAQETADFAQWLADSPLNKAAFDDATVLWHQLSALPKQPIELTRKRYFRAIPLAAAASLIFASCLMVIQLHTPTFSTGKGEQRRVMLADDTAVYLNTSSKISVNYSDALRQITLVQGEAWFDVTEQPARPFVVAGEYAIAEAVGTAFTVRETPGFTRVAVSEGVVEVKRRESSDVQSLQVGQQSTVTASSSDLQPYDAQTSLSWQRGQLIYNDVRLDELLSDLNRYLPKTMTVTDVELLETRVTAILYLDDQEAMLEALGKTLPIRWKSVSDSLIIITTDH